MSWCCCCSVMFMIVILQLERSARRPAAASVLCQLLPAAGSRRPYPPELSAFCLYTKTLTKLWNGELLVWQLFAVFCSGGFTATKHSSSFKQRAYLWLISNWPPLKQNFILKTKLIQQIQNVIVAFSFMFVDFSLFFFSTGRALLQHIHVWNPT